MIINMFSSLFTSFSPFFVLFDFIAVFVLILLVFYWFRFNCWHFKKKLLRAVFVVSCRHSILRIAQSVFATPMTIHFVEISGWSTHDTTNYSDAPAKLDELQASHGFPECRKNSRVELVPSPRAYARNGASRRWLGDKCYAQKITRRYSAVLPTSTNIKHISKITHRKYHNEPICQYCALMGQRHLLRSDLGGMKFEILSNQIKNFI